jgi:CubicO group peptidase (beta-lactamase class C family)
VSGVEGVVAPGFERVRAAFERNFSDEGELGAALCVYHAGEPVVDLWGGVADRGRAVLWSRETAAVIFSGTKGIVAICLALLIERGSLELETPVCRYWPEFRAGGKRDITVGDVVSHMAGLPGLRVRVEPDDVLDDRAMAELLAAQEPLVPPRSGVWYHAFTFGWLGGELVRRIDGRSIGQFFRSEIAEPLGLDLWLGLPASVESRVATLELASEWASDDEAGELQSPGTLAWAVRRNPALIAPDSFPWNRRAFHSAEIPGAGAIGTARSVARLYACLAEGGELNGARVLRAPTIDHLTAERSRGYERLLGMPMVFACGVQLQTRLGPFGPPSDAYGHNGAGGSMHGVWPTARVAYSYVMNRMRNDKKVDPRGQALLNELAAALRLAASGRGGSD